MRTLLITIASLAFSSWLHAGSLKPKCFDGGSDCLLSVDAAGILLESKFPEIESDSNGRSSKLIWVDRPADISMEIERIGRFQNNEICRITYRKRAGEPETPQSGLDCTMFGYLYNSPDGERAVPFFFIDADDQINSFSSLFTSDSIRPFALEIQKSLKGNGVYWTDYEFVFTRKGARIVERRTGGRRIHTKTYHYDKTGEIVRVETSTSE